MPLVNGFGFTVGFRESEGSACVNVAYRCEDVDDDEMRVLMLT